MTLGLPDPVTIGEPFFCDETCDDFARPIVGPILWENISPAHSSSSEPKLAPALGAVPGAAGPFSRRWRLDRRPRLKRQLPQRVRAGTVNSAATTLGSKSAASRPAGKVHLP